MTGRIVVGIDGSEQSGNALEWAVARARLGGEELELLHAYSFTPPVDFFGYHGVAAGQQVAWFMEFSEEVLAAAAARVRELAPELACTSTSKLGHPAVMLGEASETASAVVVGRRGLGGAASVLMGSVSNRLSVEAKCPLIVVGDGELQTTGPIVVGVDDSPFGTNALRYAMAEAAVRKTRVKAVVAYDVTDQAIQGDPELVARTRADVGAEAEATVTRALAEVQETFSAPVGVDPRAVEGRAADAILGQADDAQLIVVGTHGKGVVRRALLGSVSRQILNDAARPVAIVDLPEGT
jgi:nucleotide-binding universal stress UspA family protein